MNSTRLKFELIEPQSPGRAMNSPLAHLASRLRREEQPTSRLPEQSRLVQDLAQGLEFLIGQLAQAEKERDAAQADAVRLHQETATIRGELSVLQREFKEVGAGASDLKDTRRTLEGVVAEQQKALLLSMELMRRFEGEISALRDRLDGLETASGNESPSAETLAELEALRSRNGSLEEQLTALTTRANSLRQPFEDRIAELESQVSAAAAETTAVRESLDARIAELTSQLADAQSQASSATAEVAAIQESLNARIAELTSQLADAQSQASSATAEAAAIQESLNARIADLTSQLADAQSQASSATAETAAIQESLNTRIAAFEQSAVSTGEQLKNAQEQSAKLREELAQYAKRGDPEAAFRALEEQRDLAIADAAAARADVSIQCAEIETKDALINALERALEQQHGSLRSLETRFAEYATRLQELRIDRLRMPDPKASVMAGSSGSKGGRMKRMLGTFKQAFSPPVQPAEDGQEGLSHPLSGPEVAAVSSRTKTAIKDPGA
jgi:chromosome segregation ATPase